MTGVGPERDDRGDDLPWAEKYDKANVVVRHAPSRARIFQPPPLGPAPVYGTGLVRGISKMGLVGPVGSAP